MLHLLDCHYASNTIDNYQAGLTRLAHWTTQCNIDVKNIDEKLIQNFLVCRITLGIFPQFLNRVGADLN
jgi:site-specific recombinase XerD